MSGGTEANWHATLHMRATTSNKNTVSRSKALIVNNLGYGEHRTYKMLYE